MRVAGRRLNKSDKSLTDPEWLFMSPRRDLGRSNSYYFVPVPSMVARPPKVRLPVPRSRLILTCKAGTKDSRYSVISIEFSAEELRRLEVKIAQVLGTRKVRSDAIKPTRITRQQAKKFLI